MKLKQRAYEILEVAAEGDKTSRRFDLFILTLISLNGITLVLETVKSVHDRTGELFSVFETVSVLIFSAEYLCRLWSCVTDPVYKSALRGRLKFALTPMALIDLLAILPFYLPLLGVDLRVFRLARLFRLFRVAKLVRYSQALQSFGRTLRSCKEELLTTLIFMMFLLMLSSCLMYYAEREAQSENFSSIPASMWWAIATLTTVGYGDIYPITPAGKLIGSIIAVLGIGMFALPTSVLGAAYLGEISRRRLEPVACPHCGKSPDDPRDV
jgi:voltage-gated potassium channel